MKKTQIKQEVMNEVEQRFENSLGKVIETLDTIEERLCLLLETHDDPNNSMKIARIYTERHCEKVEVEVFRQSIYTILFVLNQKCSITSN